MSPFAWVRRQAQSTFLTVLTVLFVGLSLRLAYLDRTLVTPEAPRGIVSYELAGTVERSQSVLNSWSSDARSTAMLIQGLDALYLLVYPAWLSLAAWRLGGHLGGRWRQGGGVVSWAALCAAPLDAVENYALVQQVMHGATRAYAQLAWSCAVPKFALVAAAGGFLVAASTVWLSRRVRAA